MTLVPMLYDKLEELRSIEDRGQTYITGRNARQHRSFADVCRVARLIAGGLAARGIRRGDRVGLLLSEPSQFVAAFIACVHAGFVAVPISPPPTLGRPAAYHQRAGFIAEAAELKALISGQAAADVASLVAANRAGMLHMDVDLLAAGGIELPAERLSPRDICLVQFTSGSTGAPKGVLVDYANLAANCGALAIEGLNSNASDVAVSWLPMYHDMGLVGKLLGTLSVGMSAVFISTSVFVKYPSIWMETMSEFRGTITFAPNFALELAAMRFKPSPGALDLSCVKVVGCGAEPINAATVRKFQKCFAPYGLRPEVIMPTYGMAEATLAVAFAPLGRHFEAHVVSRTALQLEGRLRPPLSSTDALEVVNCGTAFAGHEITVRSEDGKPASEGCVGEVVVTGPSITRGYLNDTTTTAAAFDGGALKTGDLGFLRSGDLYICGRKKDLIIINGANHYPQDIEWAVEAGEISGVRKGSVVAVGVDFGRGEELVLVAECSNRQLGEALRSEVRAQARAQTGLVAADVALAGPGTIPKTTSGKLMRQEVRRRYLGGEYLGERGGAEHV